MPGWHRFLFETVGRYLAAGMRAGDRLLAIATPLGHDFRNPLSAILTTTRLALRGELGPDTTKRLARVINSGVRLQRMVEQIHVESSEGAGTLFEVSFPRDV